MQFTDPTTTAAIVRRRRETFELQAATTRLAAATRPSPVRHPRLGFTRLYATWRHRPAVRVTCP